MVSVFILIQFAVLREAVGILVAIDILEAEVFGYVSPLHQVAQDKAGGNDTADQRITPIRLIALRSMFRPM